MRLRPLTVGWVLAACLLACGGEKPEGAQCTYQPATGADDCAAGLFCLRPGACSAECQGSCVKACSVDGDCGANRTCSGRSSAETGLETFCR